MYFPNYIKTVLWDVDLKDVDLKEHQNFLIARIIDKGTLKSVKWLESKYSKKNIKKVAKVSKNISSKTKNFWKVY